MVASDAHLKEQIDLSLQKGTVGQTALSFGGSTGFDSWLLGYQDNRLPLSAWWSTLRDRELRNYVRNSVILSGISESRIAQIKNLEWAIEATNKQAEPLIPYYMDMLNNCQFENGWRSFINNWVQDYHQQDNGAFVELIGKPYWDEQKWTEDENGNRFLATPPLGGDDPFATPAEARAKALASIEGFAHLDAAACWRTGNPEYPIIYRNQWKGYFVILHRSRVVTASSFGQASELSRGIGFCAVSRSFQAAEMIQATQDYQYEKMTGQGPAIGIVRGIAIQALRQAVEDNALEMDRKGFVKWKGAALIRGDDMPGIEAGIELVDIKGTPDGFDRDNEFTLNLYMIALAWGTDPRDLGYSRGITGTTRADAETQDAKMSGRGREDAIGALEDILNRRILPPGLEFRFKIKDDLEARRKAEIEKIRAEARAIRIASAELTVPEAREIAAREGDLPPEFMASQTVVEGLGNAAPESESPVDTMADTVDGAKTLNTYQRELARLVRLYRIGELDKVAFKRDMKALIAKQFYLAWVAGAKEVDAAYDTTSDFDALVQEEYEYVQQFADAVQQTKAVTIASIRDRIGLWANQFSRIKNRAMMFLGGDKRLVWRLGATEQHCTTCFALNGHIATSKEWAKANIQPQDRQLACSGYRCDCRFEVTSQTPTRGPIPRVGIKATACDCGHCETDTPILSETALQELLGVLNG